jgi:hypothetical protein
VISSLLKEISLSERPGCAAAAVLVDDRQARGEDGVWSTVSSAPFCNLLLKTLLLICKGYRSFGAPGMNNKNMFRYLHIGQLKDDGNLEEVTGVVATQLKGLVWFISDP